MKCMKGEELRDYCKAWLEERHITASRDIADKFHATCLKNDLRVVLLVGLKGTGKTTLMMQEILRIGDFDHTLFIQCDESDRNAMDDFVEIVKANEDKRFIFVNEVTLMKDFIPSSSRFSDVFIWSRYIFSGTDSFSMTLAMEDELFDRAHAFHMLPLFYPEAHRVFHQDFETYLRYGGRIENGASIYESLDSFRATDGRVISDNFMHSLAPDILRRDYSYRKMRNAVEEHRMPEYIEKALLRCNQPFMEQVVEEAFASLSLASAGDKAWEKDVRAGLRSVFSIWKMKNDPDRLWASNGTDDAKECLSELRIIRWHKSMLDDSEEIAFYQPGLRFCLSLEMLRQLREAGDIYWMKYGGMLEQLWNAVEKTIQENVMKEFIALHLGMNPDIRDHYEITKYWKTGLAFLWMKKNLREAILMDVRATETCQPESDGTEIRMDAKEIRKHIQWWSSERIRGKIVLYLGEDTFCENGVCYLHAGDFLCHPQEKLQEAVRHYQSSDASKENDNA